jgi:hypothetical protein
VIKKFKIWFSIISLVSVTNFISIPAKATSNDAITLESISAVSATVLTGENIVMQLEVAVPTGYSWDPQANYLGYTTRVLFCKNSIYSESAGIGSCSYGSTQAQYALGNIHDINETNSSGYKIVSFKISGTLFAGAINDYKLFRVIIAGADLPMQEEMHKYDRGKAYAIEGVSDRTDVNVPTFLNGDVSVVAPSPTPTPTPTPTVSETPSPTPTPTPTATESATPSPSAIEVLVTTSSSSAGSSSVVARTVAPVLIPIAIEASGKTIKKIPNKNGDLTWQRAKEISSSSGWVQKKNRRASGGRFISTSNPLAKINISTSGDAFTLRYMTGKNMGKIRVMVDGKKLAEFKTSSLTTRSKAKSWIGIGPGKHKIEIIPILDPGQSIGVDAFQVARAV